MKKLIVAAFALSLFACNSSEKTKEARKNTDLIQQNLKGKVETLVENAVNFDSVGKRKGDSAETTTSFNEDGYVTKVVIKDTSGKQTEQVMTHNADGTFKEFKSTKDGKQTYRLVTEVDKDGNYTGGKGYDSSDKQTSYYTDLKTNEYGEVYAGKEHFMNGKIKGTFDMKYDGPNFLGGKSTDSTGKTSYEGTVKLDDKGNPIQEHSTTREKDSTKTTDRTYKYDSVDDKGNWTQRTNYDEKGKVVGISKRSFTYYKD